LQSVRILLEIYSVCRKTAFSGPAYFLTHDAKAYSNYKNKTNKSILVHLRKNDIHLEQLKQSL